MSYIPDMAMAAITNGNSLDVSGQIQAADDIAMATMNDCLNVQASGGMSEGKKESVVDVLVKFLMSRNISLDVINDSHFQTFLKGVAQHGEPCRSLLENSTMVQKSLWKFDHVVKLYMQSVMTSWKTTGCTMLSYNLKQGKGDQDKLVLGLYCPKGFIFVQLPPSSERVNQHFNYYKLGNAFRSLVPDSSSYPIWNRVIRFVQHGPSNKSECQYQARDLSDTNDSIDAFITKNACTSQTECIRQQVLAFWRTIYETVQWVKCLIRISDAVYELIVTSDLYGKFYHTLKQKEAQQVAGGYAASSIARLDTIMELQLELTAWLSQLSKAEKYGLDREVRYSIGHDFLWRFGNEILQVLAPLFEIPSLMDTLVPTAGYLEVAIDKAKGVLETYSESHCQMYKPIWDLFEEWRISCADSVQEATSLLSPAYFVRHKVQKKGLCAWCLYDLAEAYEDVEALDAEIKAYSIRSSNPFANVSISECEANHPITLWSKYGGGFPLLQKCAYKLLTQPSCCLCKQVEKHMSKLQGTDNYVLRLNALMMEEFTKMGDQVYQPIHI